MAGWHLEEGRGSLDLERKNGLGRARWEGRKKAVFGDRLIPGLWTIRYISDFSRGRYDTGTVCMFFV